MKKNAIDGERLRIMTSQWFFDRVFIGVFFVSFTVFLAMNLTINALYSRRSPVQTAELLQVPMVSQKLALRADFDSFRNAYRADMEAEKRSQMAEFYNNMQSFRSSMSSKSIPASSNLLKSPQMMLADPLIAVNSACVGKLCNLGVNIGDDSIGVRDDALMSSNGLEAPYNMLGISPQREIAVGSIYSMILLEIFVSSFDSVSKYSIPDLKLSLD